MSDTMHTDTKIGELVPVLSEILKIEANTAALLGDAQTKAHQIVDQAQQRTREVATRGQLAAKEQAALEVQKIQNDSIEQAAALKNEGELSAGELRAQLERNLDSAIDLVIDRVIEGDSCLTGTGEITC